jgi:hypothetical protein
MADVDIKKIIQSLADTDWSENNEAQMKAVQLLKGLALSEDPASNMFMKGLSDSSTAIAKAILSHDDKKENKNEALIIRTNAILEGMADVGNVPTHIKNVKSSETVNRASALL